MAAHDSPLRWLSVFQNRRFRPPPTTDKSIDGQSERGCGRSVIWLPRIKPFRQLRSEEHTSELQSLMRNSYAVFCLKKNTKPQHIHILQPPKKQSIIPFTHYN